MGKDSKTEFGMLSVKAGIDNNPKPTQADRIAGATKKANGGVINGLKKMGMNKGGLAGRLAQRGYGKARS
jgi:hypothetical protein